MISVRKAGFALLGLAFATGLAGGAHAQSGRSGMSTSTPAENVNAFRELSAFGVCFARFYRNNALALLATTPGEREEGEVFRRLIGGEQNCLVSGTWTSGSLVYYRGVIAEGLLRSGEGVPERHRLPAVTVAEVRNLGDAARCYASGHRAEVEALLATRLGSPEEVAAVSSLWNGFRACMPPGLNVRLNAPWIRFLLAEAALRLAPAEGTQ